MSVSEPERHELYQTFEGLIGKRRAETLMALLPPTGWGDVATRRDLETIHQAFQAHQVASDLRLDAMESRINERILRTALMVNIPTLLAAVGLAFAATRIG